MSWALAILYVFVGIVLGIGAMFWCFVQGFRHEPTRLRMFRMMAMHYPDTFERAWHDENVLRPRHDSFDDDFVEENLPHDTQREFQALRMVTCKHCRLPWPQDDGILVDHPDVQKPFGNRCPGSGSSTHDLDTP